MNSSNVIPWFSCVAKTAEADRNVRKYFGLGWKPYIVKYDPNRAHTNLFNAKGADITSKLGGTTNGRIIVYPIVPTLLTAEHEVAHLYHIRTNITLKDTVKTKIDFADYLLWTVALEALANAFENRNIPAQATQSILHFSEILDCPPNRNQLDSIVCEYSKLATDIRVQNLINFQALRDASKDESDHLLKQKISAAYRLGIDSGKWLFTDWSAKPVLKTSIDLSDRGLLARMDIMTSTLKPDVRKTLLNNLLRMDYADAGAELLTFYEEHINPLVNHGYKELSDKLRGYK